MFGKTVLTEFPTAPSPGEGEEETTPTTPPSSGLCERRSEVALDKKQRSYTGTEETPPLDSVATAVPSLTIPNPVESLCGGRNKKGEEEGSGNADFCLEASNG